MYITKTTDKVKDLFSKVEKLDDMGKLRFLLYTYGLLNNNQINDKNEENPNLVEDDELVIFNMKSLGFSDNYCEIFIQYLIMINNILDEENKIYEENGNIIGIKYTEKEIENISIFERLNFSEKLDVFSELFIRYDNETYFTKKLTMLTWKDGLSGFDIAKMIQDIKKELL